MKHLFKTAFALMLSTSLFAQDFDLNWSDEGPATSNAQLGKSLATGDINDDGWDDMVVGEPNSDKVHIYLGTATGFPSSPDQTISGPSTYKFGQSVILGNFNSDDDDYLDLAISRVSSTATTGYVRIYYGTSTGSFSTTAYIEITGDNGQKFGYSLSTGDFDGNDEEDLAIGAPEDDAGYTSGSAGVYVFYGENLAAPSGVTSLTTADADWEVEYASGYDEFGWDVEITGDISGDNIRDLAVSDPFKSSKGNVFIYGYDGGSTPELLGVIEGETNSEFGKSLTRIGNVGGGDSKPDLLIGAPASGTTSKSGKAYVFFGETSTSGIGTNWNSYTDADWTLSGVGQTDAYFGQGGARLDDVNLDGIRDFAVSARRYDNGGSSEAGLVRVYFGTNSATSPSSIDIIGSNADDNFGHCVAGFTFMDRHMIAVTSPRFDNAALQAGLAEAYELSGWNKVYSECYDPGFSGYSRVHPKQMLPNADGSMAMISVKKEVQPSIPYSDDVYDGLASIIEFGNTGFIESQRNLSLPTLTGGYDQVFDPKSFVEVDEGEYLLYGERLFEYDDGGTTKEDYDLMVVYFNKGVIDWSKTYTFSTGDDLERAVKVVKLNNSSGTHTHYALLAESKTHNEIDTRVIKIDLDGDVVWSKSLETNQVTIYDQYGQGTTYTGHIDPNDMIQVYDGGDIFVSGTSSVEDADGSFIFALGLAGTWRYIKGYEETANNTRLNIEQIQTDGYDVQALFTNSYNNGVVHINPVNCELRVTTSGSVSQHHGFIFNSNITDVSFAPDGDDYDYVVSGEVSSNDQDQITFYVDEDTEEWNRVIELDDEERELMGAIKSNSDDYWLCYRTESHNTDCGSTSLYPKHMAMTKFELANGETDICGVTSSTVNVDDLDVDNDGDYDDFDHVDFTDPTSNLTHDYYDIESFTTTATTFDEDDFTITSKVVPAAYICDDGSGTGPVPFDEGLDDDATTVTETKIEDVSIRIYPNPATSELNIEVSSEEGTVRVVSLNGKEIMPATNLSQEFNQLDISNLTEGLYLLEIQTAKGITTQKFIKK